MSANNLTAKGFLNTISVAPNGNVFVNVAYSRGTNEKRQTQFISCLVSKELKDRFSDAHTTQVIHENGKVTNCFSKQLLDVTIANPYFEISDNGKFLNGTGVLTSVAFKEPAASGDSSS